MENNALPELSREEIRVLGSLIEKSRATPEYYPMTLNALKSACNQKSSRNPIVDYDEEIISITLDALRKKGLVSSVIGGGSRVAKYKHNLLLAFPLNPEEAAVLCLLMLRGSLTAGEINSNSGRLYEFDGLDEVNAVLEKLTEKAPGFVKQIGKKSGQKEGRYVHLFSDYLEEENETSTLLENNDSKVVALEARIEILEAALATLRNEFDKLMMELC